MTPTSRSLTARSRLVLGILVSALALGGCGFKGAYDLPLPGGPVNGGDSYQVTADFADILNVVPKSPVKVDDVTVGEVTSIERVGWHARITMAVRDDIDLPDNAIAQIRQVSLLGEKYVDLAAPVSATPVGHLGNGDNIPLSRTGRNPEVEEVLGALSFLLSGGGVAQLGTITKELNDALDGRTDRLRDLFTSLDGVVGTLDDQKGQIIDALQSLDHLSATLNREKSTITGALDVAGPAVKVLADQEGQLVTLLHSLDDLGTVGTRVITASKDDILSQLRSLRPVLDKLNEAGKSLAPGLNLLVSFPFPKEASEIVQGDYANTEIVANIDLSSLVPTPQLLSSLTAPLQALGLSKVQGCLTSGSLNSNACHAVLGSLSLLGGLIKSCRSDHGKHPLVCAAVRLLGVGGQAPGGGLLSGLTDGPTSGQRSGGQDMRSLLGGGS